MIRLDEKQYRAVKKMTRAACANNDCGNCLLLDDGETCVCVQSISYSLLCRYFREAVLPADTLCGLRQSVRPKVKPGEILPRLRGKDTPQTESPKREKQAFTDKNNYIASTANEYPFARNARASHRERGHFACWDSPKPLKIEKGRDETICRILHTTMTNWKPPKPCG